MTTWGAEDGEWENNQDEVTGGASPARPARCHGQQLIAREHDETAGRTVRTVRKGVILKHMYIHSSACLGTRKKIS